MEKFAAADFIRLTTYMADMRNAARQEMDAGKATIRVLGDTHSGMKKSADNIKKTCKALGLSVSTKVAIKLEIIVSKNPIDVQAFHAEMRHLEEDIRYEMQETLFFHVPSSRAVYYNQKELFGVDVNAKIPTIQFDMVEAGNCYASGRGTACVFHLMRIMEVGVQKFGTKLGVTYTDAKLWQNILDETNKAIKALLPKDPVTKAMCEASANLYAVKLAWRNEVMHPNDKYTLEEAEDLIRAVKTFMKQLASII